MYALAWQADELEQIDELLAEWLEEQIEARRTLVAIEQHVRD